VDQPGGQQIARVDRLPLDNVRSPDVGETLAVFGRPVIVNHPGQQADGQQIFAHIDNGSLMSYNPLEEPVEDNRQILGPMTNYLFAPDIFLPMFTVDRPYSTRVHPRAGRGPAFHCPEEPPHCPAEISPSGSAATIDSLRRLR